VDAFSCETIGVVIVPVQARQTRSVEYRVARCFRFVDATVFASAVSVAVAFDLWSKGNGSADEFHLSSPPAGASFISFDRTFVRLARQAGAAGISGL